MPAIGSKSNENAEGQSTMVKLWAGFASGNDLHHTTTNSRHRRDDIKPLEWVQSFEPAAKSYHREIVELAGNGPKKCLASRQQQKRHRTTFNQHQLSLLEEAFQQNNYPTATTRDALAVRTSLDTSRIQVWFQNRRAKHKKQISQAIRCFASTAASNNVIINTCSNSNFIRGQGDHKSNTIMQVAINNQALWTYPTSCDTSSSRNQQQISYLPDRDDLQTRFDAMRGIETQLNRSGEHLIARSSIGAGNLRSSPQEISNDKPIFLSRDSFMSSLEGVYQSSRPETSLQSHTVPSILTTSLGLKLECAGLKQFNQHCQHQHQTNQRQNQCYSYPKQLSTNECLYSG